MYSILPFSLNTINCKRYFLFKNQVQHEILHKIVETRNLDRVLSLRKMSGFFLHYYIAIPLFVILEF